MEKPKKVITPDYVQGKLKQGWVMQDFCKDLEISEEALISFINKHSNNRIYGTFLRQVQQNEQRAERNARKQQKKAKTPDDSGSIEAEPIVVADKKEPSLPVVEAPKEEVDPTTKKINSLQRKIQSKEAEVEDKNRLKAQLIAEQEHLNLKIVRIKTNIDRLYKELGLEKQNLSKASHRLSIITTHMSSVESDITRIEGAISNHRAEIMKLKKVSIFVSANGEITIDKKVEIPDSWKELYPTLLSDSIVEDITVKQVQQLAKLLVLYEMLKKEDSYFEFIFESDSSDEKDSVKTLFELFTENKN